MDILVCDTSALIELAKLDLIAKMFKTDLKFAVSDFLFSRNSFKFAQNNLKDLRNFGFRVQQLDPQGVALSLRFRSAKPALSTLDSFAIAIAKQEIGSY